MPILFATTYNSEVNKRWSERSKVSKTWKFHKNISKQSFLTVRIWKYIFYCLSELVNRFSFLLLLCFFPPLWNFVCMYINKRSFLLCSFHVTCKMRVEEEIKEVGRWTKNMEIGVIHLLRLTFKRGNPYVDISF